MDPFVSLILQFTVAVIVGFVLLHYLVISTLFLVWAVAHGTRLSVASWQKHAQAGLHTTAQTVQSKVKPKVLKGA